jgi:GTPase SAR1 family protein
MIGMLRSFVEFAPMRKEGSPHTRTPTTKQTAVTEKPEEKEEGGMSLYKITVLGTGGVGKTAVTIRLCSNHFVEYYGTRLKSSDRTYRALYPLPQYLSSFNLQTRRLRTVIGDKS